MKPSLHVNCNPHSANEGCNLREIWKTLGQINKVRHPGVSCTAGYKETKDAAKRHTDTAKRHTDTAKRQRATAERKTDFRDMRSCIQQTGV